MDKPVKLTVYSTKNQDVRDVELTPTQTWGGSGLLGVIIMRQQCSWTWSQDSILDATTYEWWRIFHFVYSLKALTEHALLAFSRRPYPKYHYVLVLLTWL